MLQDHRNTLEKLSARWRNLEIRIKDAEQITENVAIPAINELRYCGRRFFEAWVLADSEMSDEARTAFNDHVNMAIQYFNNADHDLTDALVSFFAERKSTYLQKYGIKAGNAFYPTIMGWYEKIDAAQALIRNSRAERHERMAYYTRIETEILPDLIKRYREITYSEELYVKKYKRHIYIVRAERILILAAAIFGLIVYSGPVWIQMSNLVSQIF